MKPIIVAFYSSPRVQEILGWSNDRLESVHDYIQLLFPLQEPSPVNPAAPVLDDETISVFRASPELMGTLRESFLRMLKFYGLHYENGEVRRAPDFRERAANWLHPGNHNHLRITRILKCLGLLGLEPEAGAFFTALQSIYKEFPNRITGRTFQFWRATQ